MKNKIDVYKINKNPAKIALMSDSHGLSYKLTAGLKAAGEVDALIFLGDGASDLNEVKSAYPSLEIIPVKGNNDSLCTFPTERIVEVAGARLYCTHGHDQRVGYDLLDLKLRAMELGADAALFGHTHLFCDQMDEIRLINPSSVAIARNFKNSCCVLVIEDKNIELLKFNL